MSQFSKNNGPKNSLYKSFLRQQRIGKSTNHKLESSSLACSFLERDGKNLLTRTDPKKLKSYNLQPKKLQPKNLQPAFTLLEILLVVAAIAILAGIVILAINPIKQLGDTRNAQRRADVNTILNATYQYTIDNNGTLPTIQTNATCTLTAAYEVCKLTATGTCVTGTALSVLTTNQKYLTSMPIDPTVSSTDGTGYYIVKSTNGRVTVCAPSAEQSATISITR